MPLTDDEERNLRVFTAVHPYWNAGQPSATVETKNARAGGKAKRAPADRPATGLTPFLLGLAFSVHLASALSILFMCPGEIPSRFVTPTVVALALSLGLYLPAGWLLTRFADAHTITMTVTPFEEGDVVFVNQWAYLRSPPQVGEVVFYDRAGVDFPARLGHVAMRVQTGQDIDRILAGPGSRVRWQNGELTVNGRPSPLRPLNPAQVPPRLSLSVPEAFSTPSAAQRQINITVATPRLSINLSSQVIGKDLQTNASVSASTCLPRGPAARRPSSSCESIASVCALGTNLRPVKST